MSKQVQRRRGTTVEHSTFTGASGEITIDTIDNALVVHDGSTVGGFRSYKPLQDIIASSTGSTLVGYIQGDTGSVSRLVSDKLKETVSVTDFGAVGDGSTDDTSAIQSAINAVTAGTVFFPSGTYAITDTLVLKPYCSYKGEGAIINSSTIIQKDGANIQNALISNNAWNINSTSADGPIYISNLFVDGNKANNPSSTADGIRLMTFYSVLENVHVFESNGDGIKFTDQNKAGASITGTAVENKLLGCRVSNTDGNGISVSSGATSAMTDGFIEHCIVAASGQSGITLGRSAGWKICNNYLYNNGFHGIACSRSGNSIVSNNHIDDYGASATTGSYSAIFIAQISDNKPVLVESNNIINNQTVVGTTYKAVTVSYGTGITTGEVQVIGNSLNLNASETAISVQGTGYGITSVIGNKVTGHGSRLALVNNGSVSNVIEHYSNSFDKNFDTISGSGTPSVLHGSNFKTVAGTITLSGFDGGFDGQTVRIVFEHSAYTVDFTGTTLKGNSGADWSPSIGDFMECTFDGTNWYCSIIDTTV